MKESDFQKALPQLLSALVNFPGPRWSLDSQSQLLGRHRRARRFRIGDTISTATTEEGSSQYFYATSTLHDDCVVQNPISLPNDVELLWIYSITYSPTWNSPVLYFTAESDTGLLSRTAILQELEALDDDWNFISAEEHPITGSPAFFLHPCQSAEIVSTICPSQETVLSLWAWCAMVLTAVGIPISPGEYQKVREQLSPSE